MVHIVSTGVMGYFLGHALYASSALQEKEALHRTPWLPALLHMLFGVSKKEVYRVQLNAMRASDV